MAQICLAFSKYLNFNHKGIRGYIPLRYALMKAYLVVTWRDQKSIESSKKDIIRKIGRKRFQI